MYDEDEIKAYLQKIENIAKNPEFVFGGTCWNRKKRIDDVFCCIIGLFPPGYRKALRNKALKIDEYQSVAAFNRLVQVLTQPVLFFSAFYQYRIGEVQDIFKILNQNIIIDLNVLDREDSSEIDEDDKN